jgi:dihydroxyacetone kinase-like protein
VPAAGKPTFDIGDGEMEIGVGIHGEPGRRRDTLKSADAIADEMLCRDPGRSRRQARGPALLLVNGFGGTPLMELYLMYNSAQGAFSTGRGVTVARSGWSAPMSPRSTWPAVRSH